MPFKVTLANLSCGYYLPNQVTIKKDMADDPSRNVICRCELVTEAEVPPAVADVIFRDDDHRMSLSFFPSLPLRLETLLHFDVSSRYVSSSLLLLCLLKRCSMQCGVGKPRTPSCRCLHLVCFARACKTTRCCGINTAYEEV